MRTEVAAGSTTGTLRTARCWQGGGRAVARRNLVLSIFAEFLGFAVWALWSIVVPQLNGVGFALTIDQMFWLVSVPALVGATLRIPYTLAVPTFGGRNWTVVSALLLLLPALGLAWAVSNPGTSFGVLLVVAGLAGFGGGNFASSMANISFFYPEREKGRALGLNAAGGNIGTAVRAVHRAGRDRDRRGRHARAGRPHLRARCACWRPCWPGAGWTT